MDKVINSFSFVSENELENENTTTQKKISQERGRELVSQGLMTEEAFYEGVRKGIIAGEKRREKYYEFVGTDMTFYFPGLAPKKGKSKDANNIYIEFFDYSKDYWKKETQPVFDRLIQKGIEMGVIKVNK